jgi:D-proline reductase (dithiol) PrdD
MNKEIELRRLAIKAFHIKNVVFGDENSVNTEGIMTINKGVLGSILNEESLIENIDLQIIVPNDHDRWTNAIMDFVPISAKVLGKLGEGITHTLTGVYVMLTGIDSSGLQISRYGTSYGTLKDHVCFDKAGTPGRSDFIISFDVTLAAGAGNSRPGPTAAHRACDNFCQIFREKMKKFNGNKCNERHDFYDKINTAGKRIAIVKQVPGQGAMFNTQLLPAEPSGFLGGRSVIDLGNVPVILTPNEYRDGALRSM